jgi:hypothetical protein
VTGSSDKVKQSGSNGGATGPTYVDYSVEQLKKAVPALHGIKLEAGYGASDSAIATSDMTASILEQTGDVITAMLPRVPNLIATEEVKQTIDPTSENAFNGPPIGRNSRSGGEYQTIPQYRTTFFTYRIVPGQDRSNHELGEYRTDAKNRPVDDVPGGVGSSRSVGFGTLWLLFFPGNQQGAHFRYVGRQKIGGHETFVLVFAQIPGKTNLGTVIGTAGNQCLTYIQGVVWIDQSTFNIFRLQTDLLSPLPDIHMNQLRSTLKYSEVKIKQRNLTLWLPSDVDVSWRVGDRDGEEIHRYSHYRLFGATATILPN